MLSVLKLGGSVLRDAPSYATAARFLATRLAANTGERLVVIVSAPYGMTDTLLAPSSAMYANGAACAAAATTERTMVRPNADVCLVMIISLRADDGISVIGYLPCHIAACFSTVIQVTPSVGKVS